jgi:nucleobase:cation symporter-1, NCS1 family
VIGHRTGVNMMVLSRTAFGRRGAYLPAAVQLLMTMGWLGVNTWVVLDLVLGIFKHMGYDNPGTGTKYAVGIGIMAVQVVIAIVGFYLIQAFEKFTVPIAAAIVLVMSILAWTKVDVVWTHSTAHGADKLTAVTQLLTAIGVGWGITWLTWSADYTRFIKPGTPDKRVFWTTWASILIPTVWLGFLGASIASGGVQNDPADFVTVAFGSFSIPILFLVMHGPVATNILNLYSATLAALSLDVKLARWKVSIIVSIVGTGALIWFIESENWANRFDQWLASVVLWISAWAGVMCVDYLVFRRGKIDVQALYAPPKASIYGDVNWAAVIGMLAGVVAGWAWGYGLTSYLQGPIAKATHNVDLSWLTGFGVAAILYYVLRPFFSKEAATQAATTS